MKRILVTGAFGFIGQNLVLRLKEANFIEVLTFSRSDKKERLKNLISQVDCIIHLAGVNRPSDDQDFVNVNVNLTREICNLIKQSKRYVPIIFASSTQIVNDSQYGQSKLEAEEIIREFVEASDQSAVIFRLPGVFGKFCKPNYNSVVSTFCYNIVNDIPIKVDDPNKNLELVYIDDFIDDVILTLDEMGHGFNLGYLSTIYDITLGNLAKKIFSFKDSRKTLISEAVGTGITRALYSTYISYLSNEQFIYDLPKYEDERGMFVELLKTKDSGQFSFFTIRPGITRGSHYHHSKTEKFCVVNGTVRLQFRKLGGEEIFVADLSENKIQIIETIPGWVHNITNTGQHDALVVTWANEIFDRSKPDTISQKV